MPRITYGDLTHVEVLNRNRGGQVTPEQAQRIRQMLRRSRASVVTGLMGLACLLIVSAISLEGCGLLRPGSGCTLAPPDPDPGLVLFVTLALLSGGVLLTWVGRALRRVLLSEADLRQRRIAQGDGIVAWGRGHYRLGMYTARVGARWLLSPSYVLPLPPGPYRCLYLDRSGWLLAAQPLPGAGTPAALQAVISRQHGFSEGDLAANRAGQLSPRQRGAIRGQGLCGVALGLVPGALGWLLGLRLLLGPGAQSVAEVLMVAFLLLGGTGGSAVLLAYAARLLDEARGDGHVGAAEGALGVRYVPMQRMVKVFYDLDGVALELSGRMARRQAGSSVIEGRRYRVYYRKRNSQVLSLEAVRSPKGGPAAHA